METDESYVPTEEQIDALLAFLPIFEREGYVNEPERLAGADMLTIRRLLTLHLRKDRFVEGHFAGMIGCGHLVGVLRRLGVLRGRGG